MVTCSREKAAEVGAALCESAHVAKISFTGSTLTGKWLLERSAAGIKRVSLELGGNAPFIVFDSADLEAAATGALASRFRCSGQVCLRGLWIWDLWICAGLGFCFALVFVFVFVRDGNGPTFLGPARPVESLGPAREVILARKISK